ncbi:urease accessory protein UreD [Mycobacterium sp. THU-M104]|uniref:urease accessory protein UreD n=1 Tax=Mycobacterium sp. THU-M104 TaxID=3410515 RepID=UPI003B9D45A1
MRSELLVIAAPNRLPRIECRAGAVTARCTAPDTVHLVSAAANPLGGDAIEIRVVVEPGARLKIRSAAASVALPGPATPTSRARWEVEVAGDLDIDLEPTVVAAHARHLSDISVLLHEEASIRLRERVQIGRHGERDRFWSGALCADRADRPLTRHRVELGAGSLADDVLGAPRANVSELCYPAIASAARADSRMTVLALADGGTLSTWQGEVLSC